MKQTAEEHMYTSTRAVSTGEDALFCEEHSQEYTPASVVPTFVGLELQQ